MNYAAFKKGNSCRMVPLANCELFKEEYQARWFCIVNPSYKYIKINSDLEAFNRVVEEALHE